MITGSLCLSEILAKAKEQHSAFTKAQNGKVYFNILVWENDTPDEYGNHFSIQLNAKKDAPEEQKKKYIGNMKYLDQAQPPKPGDIPAPEDIEDLPF